MYLGSDEHLYETNGFNTQIKNLPTWETIKANGTYTPDGTNTEEKLGSYKVDGYFYYVSGPYYIENPVTEARTYISLNELFTVFCDVNGDAPPYWLASIGVGGSHGRVFFIVEAVNSGLVGVEASMCFYDSEDYGNYDYLGICPVVCLKDEIPPKINGPEISIPNYDL